MRRRATAHHERAECYHDGIASLITATARRDVPPRSATLDLLIGLVGLMLAAGFSADGWAHLHVAAESFFTPYHTIFYTAMVIGAIVVTVAALLNRSRGYTGFPLPSPYRFALLGIPVFFIGGVLDLIWHTVFGVEERVEAVT